MLGNSWSSKTKIIHLHRKKGTQFGFSIRGGREHGVGIFVSHVEPGSEADQKNLKVGDEITRINGCSLSKCIHKEVLNLIGTHNHVTLHVKSVGVIPIKNLSVDVGLTNQISSQPLLSPSSKHDPLTWKSVNNNSKDNSFSDPPPTWSSFSTMKISIDMTGHTGLGCSICKGPKEKPGIFVQSTKINGLAQNVGLQVGDQILQVNGMDISDFDFQDVVSHLKSSHKLDLVVRKGAGIDLFPVESSGYNSSTSSLHEENLLDEKLGLPKVGQEIPANKTTCLPIEKLDVTDERVKEVERVEEVEETEETEETEIKTETEIETVINNMAEDLPEVTFIKEHNISETVTHVTRVTTTVDVHHNDIVDDENDVVEGIRKVAEEEIRRDAQTQTASNQNEEASIKIGEKWRRTPIADIIDSDGHKGFPVPPPLPVDEPVRIEEEYESKTEKKSDIKHITKNSRTFPSKAAEEIQKRQQHDLLIEEFKRVRKLMFVPEENANILPPPQGWETDTIDVERKMSKSTSQPEMDEFTGVKPPITVEKRSESTEVLYIDVNQPRNGTYTQTSNHDNFPQIRISPNITDSRYHIPEPPNFFFSQSKPKPNVTIGTYQTKNRPNKLSFLQNGKLNENQNHERNETSQTKFNDNKIFDRMENQTRHNGHGQFGQFGKKFEDSNVVTVIHNGPTKSTAFIHTNGSKLEQDEKLDKFSNFEKNKVKIRVKADVKNNWKHNQRDEFPIILEELPKSSILVEDFNPLKLFTESQIGGRQVKMYSIPKGNAMDIIIEGGFGSSLGGRIIVSKIREGSEIYKQNVISKGDQIMWVNGCSTIDITLSQAQGILREAAKSLKEPLKIIVAKAPSGLYSDASYFNT